ncbi:amidohydrolase family protein [Aeromicrobium fastidiosum]|uniref:amidohydrolase family protein n=1 Tax=Aeromicrobium fastidiosum TaxID=52699 RepID=UPI00165EEA20|nr:amidohydrolase family protein [Aeromicrobium fastidiosum]MBP2389049.1 aminocarboxymuconate-semialdehyde decarboxylase [Aeromicrobium fastidiosum]
MNGPTTDVHTHLAPAIGGLDALEGVQVVGDTVSIDGRVAGPAALYDEAALLGWLAERGLDQAWVSVPPPFFRQGLDPQGTSAWVAALNDGIAERLARHDALHPLAYLPLDQPEVALAEIARLGGDPRFSGWCAAAASGSLRLDDSRLAPVWDALEAGDRPVLLHPGATPDRRLDHHYLANLLGNPVETTVAAAELVFGDVLGRRPLLRIVLVHCGGAVPALVGRWQRGVDSARPGVQPLTIDPREAVRRLWVDCLAHDAALLDLALSAIGGDKVVVGSDWPFPMGLDDPLGSLQHLSAETVHAISHRNVTTLLGGHP